MLSSKPRGALIRAVIACAFALPLVLAFHGTEPSGQALRTRPSEDRSVVLVKAKVKIRASLYAVGDRYVSTPIPVRGYTGGASARKHRLVLQRSTPKEPRWVTRATRYVRNGRYTFPAQTWATPGWVKFRTVLYSGGKRLRISNVMTVRMIALPVQAAPTCASAPSPSLCPPPASSTELRTVEKPDCPQLTVAVHQETRTINWTWSTSAKKWVQAPTGWVTVPGSASERAAGAADCVKVVSHVPANALLPDIRMKDLTKCGIGDMQATNNTCFKIDPAAPFNPDFPQLEGKKLLKFGVITLNVGAGPAEIVADRSGANATEWQAFQTLYDSSRNPVGSLVDQGVQFYFAGDGHNHWHVRDFDDYELLSSDGTMVARAEKHGYCMQDNTTYQGMPSAVGVPPNPVYMESKSCGKGLPNALMIIHGLSRGWGDTYPSSLPDQAIDITGVPNGTYTVQVHADAVGAVLESDESNNTTSVKVTISGNTVTVVPGSSTGGLQ
ncbi:lysyl oxidase family protein [Marmoricola sp. RAF53]|uniref:lysyl oxidase family protein n=1 Tax=Marmoricola sp. RAF53 TaxID=3233059 RepID=UPI003F9A95FC